MASASCMGAAGMLARNQTPMGVPMAVPMTRGVSERQWMSRQRPGSMWRLAATSSMKMAGMKICGAITKESEVMARSEKPKPE